MTEPRRHHSVPQFLLKGFSQPRGRVLQTRVLDKMNSQVFAPSIKDTMVQHDFNAIKTEQGAMSLETYISQIESEAAPIIARLIQTETTAGLSEDERQVVATFVALQLIRGTGHRAQYRHLATALRKVLLERGFPVDDERFRIPDARDVKLQALHAIATTLPEYAEHLWGKDMLIFKSPVQCEFIIGDNPVSMDNHRDYGFKGNIGLAVRGIEIYLPISKRHTLGLWATDLAEEMRTTIADARNKRGQVAALALLGVGEVRVRARKNLVQLDAKLVTVERLLQEVEAGGPVTSDSENIDRFNSMQVVYAERYLASASGYFDLAKRMLVERPELRLGGLRGDFKFK